MATICTHFAETVDPNGENLPQWDVYLVENETYMESGADTGQKSELVVGEMALT